MAKLMEWMSEMVGGLDGPGDGGMKRAILVCEVLGGQAVIKLYGVKEGAVIETLDEKDVAKLWPEAD